MLRFLWLVAALVVAVPAWAANVSLSLGVSTIEASQTTRATVTVVGEQPAALPSFPATPGVRIRFRERASEFVSTPSTGIVQTYRYIFEVTPEGEGVYPIGPAEVGFRDKTVKKTESVTLTVRPRTAMGAPKEEIVAISKFRRESVWEGEIVLYDATLTARINIRDVQWSFPDFEGLQVPANVSAQTTQTRIGDPSGDITIVKTVIPLIAAGTGDRTQPPAVARVSELSNRMGPFGIAQSRQRNEPATRSPLTIRPLPKGPDDFSGLVGEFSIHSTLEKTEKVKVGESVGWTVTILGDGVVDGFDLPELKDLKGVRVYRDESHTAGGLVEGEYIGRKTFSMVLVPTERGVIELPDLTVVVFSPKEGRYVTKKVELGKLAVLGSGTKLEFEDFGTPGEVDSTEGAEPVDLEEVYTWGAATTVPLAPVLPLVLILVLGPGLLVLVADGVGGVRAWVARRRGPAREVRGKARLKAPPADPAERLAVCDLALREALADRTGVAVGELRRDAAMASLPPEVAENVQQAFFGLDRARFAGGEMPEDAVARVRIAIDQLERAA
ncbi:MAG: BatD family protein [Alphaproteobacteria bacterium]|nr:BatD family protein [Alphaproteobacteria bacterium]